MPNELDSFLYATNSHFIAELYALYLTDPVAVDASWAKFFAGLRDDEKTLLSEMRGADWAPSATKVISRSLARRQAEGLSTADTQKAISDSLRLLRLIRAYRDRGHLYANLDPLGLQKPKHHPELDYKTYGFTDDGLDTAIYTNGEFGETTLTLRQTIEKLKAIYCGTVGAEYMHLQEPEHKQWVQEHMENNGAELSRKDKVTTLERLTAAEGLEKFLHLKFPTTKRFGLDGGEALIPALEMFAQHSAELGVREIVLGMAHRGRLNVVTNIIGKPFHKLFSEFQGVSPKPDDVQGAGDVKYHLGASGDRDFVKYHVHISLTSNPSHLEAVDPVIMGKTRAKQQQTAGQKQQTVGIIIHGDAAFAGQGVVAETLTMSELEGYSTGGTVHFIINNQIGFTTNPNFSRSGHYSTDVAKMIQAPIFHVNGDDPEAVVKVARLAAEFRQKFLKDVVVDIFCYRRLGHNETDEPMFTQPLMYKAIRNHKTTRELYAQKLVQEGATTADEDKQIAQKYMAMLEAEYKLAEGYKPSSADWLEGKWSGMQPPKLSDHTGAKTAVAKDKLLAIGKALTTVPPGFNLNSKIARQLQAKAQMFESGEGIDWATGEALAFGTLLQEGYMVRLSGQDVGRGTFSQRHAILVDQETETKYLPLQHIGNKQGKLEVYDSQLSEAAVLGFEYGYSLAEPNALVIWEAQFGDFANGAQVMIDQFISAAESKWLRMSGLVMMLPHAYEGQGSEHSSARPERFLQLCAEYNMQVVNCTTPANFFHALRRQLHRKYRKPLIALTPKSLLRHKMAVSSVDEFVGESGFMRVIPDFLIGRHSREGGNPVSARSAENIKRVVLCTGKVYYDLLAAREEKKATDIAIIRVEELYPFPHDELLTELSKYKNAEVVWCQEEPQNMGYWTYIESRLEKVLQAADLHSKRPIYAGRQPSASPATGSLKRHEEEQAGIMNAALGR